MSRKEQNIFANENCSISGLLHHSVNLFDLSGLVWPFMAINEQTTSKKVKNGINRLLSIRVPMIYAYNRYLYFMEKSVILIPTLENTLIYGKNELSIPCKSYKRLCFDKKSYILTLYAIKCQKKWKFLKFLNFEGVVMGISKLFFRGKIVMNSTFC